MRNIDWKAWLSLAAIVVVCLVVTVQVVPHEALKTPLPAASPRRAPARTNPAAAPRGLTHRLDAPDRSIELGKALNEISGLSLAADGASFWAVHDEKGVLFRISAADGSTLQELDLGAPGDFEAVEEAAGEVWVAGSDGRVLVVDPAGKKPIEKLAFTEKLGVACDVEGMAWQAQQHRMLLSCKNESLASTPNNKKYPLYEVDLATREMNAEPAFVIDQQDLEAHGVKGRGFAPSGLAIHPKTGELYVLSSRSKLLVVLSPEGAVRRADVMDDEVYRQPEGIAFGPDGTLFIASEARGRKPMLHVIDP